MDLAANDAVGADGTSQGEGRLSHEDTNALLKAVILFVWASAELGRIVANCRAYRHSWRAVKILVSLGVIASQDISEDVCE